MNLSKMFNFYVIFGEWKVETATSRSYGKAPLAVSLTIADAHVIWKQATDDKSSWLPEGADYLNCYIAPRTSYVYD